MNATGSKGQTESTIAPAFLYYGGNRLSPSNVFFQADCDWLAEELCKLFNAEYGGLVDKPFSYCKVSTEQLTEYVRLSTAIDELSLYGDPDPRIYDPQPSKDLLTRAQYFIQAQEWERILVQLRRRNQESSTNVKMNETSVSPCTIPPTMDIEAFELVRTLLEKHRLTFLFFAAPKRSNPLTTRNHWELESMNKDKFPTIPSEDIDDEGEFLFAHQRKLERFAQAAVSQFGSGDGSKPRIMHESGSIVEVEGGSFPFWTLDDGACVYLEESANRILTKMRESVRDQRASILSPFVSDIKKVLHDTGKSKWYAADTVKWSYLSRIDSILYDLRTAGFIDARANEGEASGIAKPRIEKRPEVALESTQASDDASIEELLKGIPLEDIRNSSVILLMLFTQAYYKMLEATISIAGWLTMPDVELNHSYLWTCQNLTNLLKNSEHLADFPKKFEPILPDLYPSTIVDLEWQSMIAPEADEFLATVQRYVVSKGTYDPEENSPAWIMLKLFRPGIEIAIQRAENYNRRLTRVKQKMFDKPSENGSVPPTTNEKTTQDTLREESDGRVIEKFQAPQGSRWSDLTIRFVDSQTVVVKVNDKSKRLLYSEMGMVDGRSRSPTKQWYLLEDFAKGHGRMTWKSAGASRDNRKRRKILSDNLKAYFGIPGEPIMLTEDKKGWRTVFAVTES